jgi:CHASE2 domain-containing sensor protein
VKFQQGVRQQSFRQQDAGQPNLRQRQGLSQRVQAALANWRVSLVPGSIAIALIALARLAGGLQSWEWSVLDTYLRHRPGEPMDEQVLIVGITEADLAELKTYPISDQDLANLIQTLQKYQPAVIGVDIFRDQPVPPGHQKLTQAFQVPPPHGKQPNVIAIERLALNSQEFAVKPPPTLSSDQVGFVNAILDNDGVLRRSLLFTEDDQKNVRESFSSLLANLYLETQGIVATEGSRDRQSIRLGKTEIPRFQPDTGGYAQTPGGGLVTLINYRSGREPFRVVSLAQIKIKQFQPS